MLRRVLLVDVAISEYNWMRPEVISMKKSVNTVALELSQLFHNEGMKREKSHFAIAVNNNSLFQYHRLSRHT